MSAIYLKKIVPEMCGYVKTFFNNEKFNITALYILLLIIYSNFITNITFGNHFFPNVLIQQYPSYRTLSEGRWGQDILIQFFGGGGNAAFQALVGMAILAINSIIISRYIYKAKHYVVIAFFIATSPFYIEYFQFQLDAIPWLIADSLIVLATVILINYKKAVGILISSLLYALVLSIYQPKIALILILANLAVISILVEKNSDIKRSVWLIFKYILSIFIGVFLYSAVFLIVTSGDSHRTNINSFSEMSLNMLGSYQFVFDLLKSPYPYIPKSIQFLPTILFLIGVIHLFFNIRKNQKITYTLLICILIAPILIYASSIINSYTTAMHTRFLIPYFLFLTFMIIQASNNARYGKFIAALICLITFNSAIQIANEGRFVAVKTIYESNFINRIVSRLENQIKPGQFESPILIIGQIPELRRWDYIRNLPNAMIADSWPESFASFRQVDFLNFYLGAKYYRYPTDSEFKAIQINLKEKPVFPHPGSIYVENGVTVVKLEEYKKTSQVTDRR